MASIAIDICPTTTPPHTRQKKALALLKAFESVGQGGKVILDVPVSLFTKTEVILLRVQIDDEMVAEVKMDVRQRRIGEE